MPFNSNGPTSTNVWVACRPTINRTSSAARICPPFGRRAQPRRLDDRIAEVVAVLLDRFAGAHADAHAERLAAGPVVMLDRLLHPHRARQRPARRREHHHQPVTQVLHLGPARRRHRAPQQPEMRLAQLLRRLRTEARRGRGRIHQIREHERRRHRRRHPPTPNRLIQRARSDDSGTRPGPDDTSRRAADSVAGRAEAHVERRRLSQNAHPARIPEVSQIAGTEVIAIDISRSVGRDNRGRFVSGERLTDRPD